MIINSKKYLSKMKKYMVLPKENLNQEKHLKKR